MASYELQLEKTEQFDMGKMQILCGTLWDALSKTPVGDMFSSVPAFLSEHDYLLEL